MVGATVTVGTEPIGVISPRLYGNFAEHLGRCCYGGLWVGPESDVPNIGGFRKDVVEALRALPTPMIRWPGGCYADHYHWRNGIGSPAARAATLGMTCGLSSSDTHAIGTHEFMRFCELIGAEPYLCGNVATGSVQELCDWIEYVNSATDSSLTRERSANGRLAPWGVKLWGIGNESWDCGGRFDPVTYAQEYRRYARMIRDVDPTVELVAVGMEDEPLPEFHLDPEWNAKFLGALGPNATLVDHLSIHRYWIHGGPETDFDEADYYALLEEADATEGLIERTRQTIDAIAPPSHRIGIAFDEWGVWHPEARDWGPGDVARRKPVILEQANTLRDALAVAVGFEAFHRQCNSLSMTNISQVVNVLQAVIMTDGPSIALTPTYHALSLHAPHVGAQALPVEVSGGVGAAGGPSVSATASRRDGDGDAMGWAVTVVNRHYSSPAAVEISLPGMPGAGVERARLLSADAPNATNAPGEPARVRTIPVVVEELGDGRFSIAMPAHSMATVEFKSTKQDQRGGI
jgi:alpha-N-arabinofuranosidase